MIFSLGLDLGRENSVLITIPTSAHSRHSRDGRGITFRGSNLPSDVAAVIDIGSELAVNAEHHSARKQNLGLLLLLRFIFRFRGVYQNSHPF